ncbi:aspartate aminotransferase family protein [Barrientosiimonas marina]|uniref:Pyridoxal phosphate-dependent decarboxylase family protein n=1 Tax=Lentibacillus kimchii TaxID=1542911 RepID=A0ABW2UU06_9BACI
MHNKYFVNDKNHSNLNLLEESLKMGVEYKNREKVINYADDSEISSIVSEQFPEESTDLERLISEFESNILPYSTNFSSPNFMAFPDSGNSVASHAANILSGFMNQNLINSTHCSPIATYIELQTIQWLRELMGYSFEDIRNISDITDSGGIALTGGTLANTVGLLLARESLFVNAKNTGLNNKVKDVRVIMPEGIDHYSIRVAMGWLGLGEDNILYVKTNGNYTIDQIDLKEKIEKYKNKYKFIALIAYAGDSRTMAIDDFNKLYTIAKEHNIWFHVDACQGFVAKFSNTLKAGLDGIELADSIALDPHKVMWLPYNLSYLLVKNPEQLKKVIGGSDLINKEAMSFGQMTPFLGSKAFDSLKLYFVLKNLGSKKIGELVDYRYDLASYFAEKIDSENCFVRINEVTVNSVVFVYKPEEEIENIDAFNTLQKSIHQRLWQEGDQYLHTFTLHDPSQKLSSDKSVKWQMLRLFIGNPLTEESNINRLMSNVKKIAEEEYSKLFVENL